ncbi:hypothetical protein D9611_004744 [Ephemerocybe angulata]|uniref:RlpA-like protein double-psi beta-barrel domain-containing protein n=1 Tax=Ephemerocybe angulata TaxID=980116 RepID=A0A8H5EX94_9AGAR|nr:hypothetical protein D9611_004744 [Tulosesus angulatus]
MFPVAKFFVFAFAASSVSAIVVPRSTAPDSWSTEYLEKYDTYHARYLALECHSKHDTDFFESCCHPLLANESLSNRPAQCTPLSSASPAPNSSSDNEEDCDEEDEEESPPAVAATAKKASAVVKTTASSERTSATVNSGGYATYFYQNGVAGACGKVHSDSDMIAAIDGDRYGNMNAVSSQCNKQVKLTNSNNGKSVTVTIVDACPTCANSNSIDLSKGAFEKIAPLSDGMVPITWSYV